MNDSWDEMKKAKEDQYFHKLNQEAMERLRERNAEEKPRLSPISGNPMVQETIFGIVIDRCPESGGIWLDAGELEELIEKAREQNDGERSLFDSFFSYLSPRK